MAAAKGTRAAPAAPRHSPGAGDQLAVGYTSAAIAALAVAAYANALANGLVWDDPIVLNRQLLAFRSLHDIVFTPRNIPQFSPDYYRPLTTLSYLLDRAIAGNGAFMFHLSVVLYHAVASVLVYRLGLLLFAGAPARAAATWADRLASAPFLAAALFAVHPIHTESVAWGAGRSDVLACVFGVLAVLAYRRAGWSAWRRSVAAAALVFVAALAKETAASFFLLVPLSDALLGRAPGAPTTSRSHRRREDEPSASVPAGALVTAALPFAAAVALYIGLRHAALETVLGEPRANTDATLAIAVLAAIGVYLGKLLLPISQSAFISDLPTGPAALTAIGATLAGLAGAAWLAWQRGHAVVTFLLLWIGITLAPSLTIVAKIPAAPVAERYLYIPSVGFCLLAGYGAARLIRRAGDGAVRTAVIGMIVLGLATATVATVRRNAVWRSNLTLWTDTAAKNTTDGLPTRSLGATYLELGDHAKARHYLEVALQRRNDTQGEFVIHNNLGSLAMAEQRLDDAERSYRTALALSPRAADTIFNLGLIALTRATRDGSHDAAVQARKLFEDAQRLNPLDPDIPTALGQTASLLGDTHGARTAYQRALQLGVPEPTAGSVRRLLAELPP